MATTPTTPETPESPKLAEGQEEVVIKKRAFDLSKFERKSLEGKFVFTPVKDTEEALARAGNDEKRLLDLINKSLKRHEANEAKAGLVAAQNNPDLVSSAKFIMQFAANFKPLPQFAKISDKAKQKEAIFAYIRSQESLMAALRTISAAVPTEEDDEDEDDE